MTVFYTVGHSRRTVDELVALLSAVNVEHIVDVRAMPRSRANPQFNWDVLPETLASLGIAYTHCPALSSTVQHCPALSSTVQHWPAYGADQKLWRTTSMVIGAIAVFTTTRAMRYLRHFVRV